MRCSICGGHLTNQRCDDCGMIFPPEDRYTLHHTEDPNCPSHVEPGQKARPVSLAADYARHRAESAPRPQPSQRPAKPTYQNSNSGRRAVILALYLYSMKRGQKPCPICRERS